MKHQTLWSAPTARILVIASCAAASALLNGCGSGDGSADSGKQKYEVAEGGDGMSAGPGALPPLPQTGAAGGNTSPHFDPSGMSGGGAPRQPPSTPPSGLNPYKVQGETPEELVNFINSMMQSAMRPPGATRAEQSSNRQNIMTTVVAAAEKILAQQADEETSRMAAQAKLTCLTQLAALGIDDAQQKSDAFVEWLTQSDQPKLAQLGREMGFVSDMEAFAQGDNDDATAMMASFKELFSNDTKEASTIQLAVGVAGVFEQRGFETEAADILKTVAAGFADVSDPELAEAAGQLKERALLIDLGLRAKLTDYLAGKEGALQPLLEGVGTLLQGEARGVTTMSVARDVAMYLEAGNPDKAIEVYQQIAEAFKDHAKLAEETRTLSEKCAKRTSIVGQPFVVEGANLDGSPFDWSRYAGKVVLVDFWATWCGPCIEEIPNIKKNYDRYRDQGFEVVGINVDDKRSRLDQFLAIQPLPWPSVVSADSNAVGLNAPMAAKCGVDSIPFLVLVDRDGTAIAMNPRGEQLGAKLAELFPEKPKP